MADPASVATEATEDSLHAPAHKESFRALALGAIGVVFGDIGTSPLYALKESFVGHHPLNPDPLHIFGVISIM